MLFHRKSLVFLVRSLCFVASHIFSLVGLVLKVDLLLDWILSIFRFVLVLAGIFFLSLMI